MKPPPRRVFLGRDSSWAERIRVYRTADAVETAYITAVEVSLRRVFFDEMQLVTLHRARSSHSLWLLGILGGLCTLGTWLARSVTEMFVGFLAATVLVDILLLLHALVPAWVVTVFSSRTRASIRFPFRPGRARTVYQELWGRAAEVQRLAAAQTAAPGTAPMTAPAAPPPLREEPSHPWEAAPSPPPAGGG